MRMEELSLGNMVWLQAMMGLLFLAVLLLGILHYMRHHTLRIYNWDGQTYRFLGHALIRKKNDTHVVKIREHIWDISYTTRYLFVPFRQFAHRNRNGSLLIKAGKEIVWLPVEAKMRQDIYYRL